MRHRRKAAPLVDRGPKWSAGWSQYRYGSSKPVTLPRIFTGSRKQDAVDGTLVRLRDWSYSPFERQGECHAGIRSFLCEGGHSWSTADNEAGAIVAEGLSLMGAKRPSWDEGQWHHTTARENCVRCGHPIDDDDRHHGHRYCSPECARAAKLAQAEYAIPKGHELRRAAYWQLYLSAAPTFACETCSKEFKSRQYGNTTPRFCSRRCAYDAQKMAPRPCKQCSTMYQPKDGRTHFCSRRCAGIFDRIDYMKNRAPELSCLVCHSVFRAKNGRSVFCSEACHRIERASRARARRQLVAANVTTFPMLTPHVFDYVFGMAA